MKCDDSTVGPELLDSLASAAECILNEVPVARETEERVHVLVGNPAGRAVWQILERPPRDVARYVLVEAGPCWQFIGGDGAERGRSPNLDELEQEEDAVPGHSPHAKAAR